MPLVVALLSLLLLGLAPRAGAAEVGFFGPTGSMSVPREGAVAAPLPDGRVLVAGGLNEASPYFLSSAEVFDPATGSFSPTASMTLPREWAAAAPLPGGRVLIVGGMTGTPSFALLSSAEIFDPVTGSFSPTGSMSVPRSGAVAAPLPDGRVLVAGGAPGPYTYGDVLSSAEIFDPATGSFSPTGSMSVPREWAAAAPLPDGRVLVTGGAYYFGADTGNIPDTLSSAEVFNPATNSFSSAGIGSMSAVRAEAAAAPLPDGRVLVAGGQRLSTGHSDVGSGPMLSAEVFDPATNTFSSAGIGSMSIPRLDAAAAPLRDGRVLVAGGCCTGAPPDRLSGAEVFTLATNSFTFTVRDRRVIVSVQAPGKVSVADAASPLRASASKKGKKIRMLNASSGSGNPPTITVPLALTKSAKRRLKKKGRVTVKARITFTGPGGLANTQTAKLKIKGKKKK